MKNMARMLKQVQDVQKRMGEMQEALAHAEISGTAGGGLVTVTLNGKGDMRGVKIDPSLAGPDDIEVLEDLIVAAHTDAKARVEAHAAEEMKKVTGGMKLPPGFDLGM
jgi:hypothetical protein